MRGRKDMLSRAFLVFIWSRLVEGSDLPVKCATDVIESRLGSSVILPCWLVPPVDVEAMEIRWYNPNHFSTPVLLYINRMIVTDQQDERYKNRTSLSLREEGSTGLKGGDVSLRLENLSMADRGRFHCFVSGDKAYGTGTLTLSVTALGSSPVLSLQPQGDLINVTCRSCGWLPKPQLEWRSNDQTTLYPEGLFFNQEREELICVHSWILLSPSHWKWISCTIWLSGGEERDGRVDIQNIARLNIQHFCGGGAWKALSAVSLIVTLAAIAVSLYFYRKHKTGYMTVKKDEEAWGTACLKTDINELRKAAVSVSLDDTSHRPGLTVKDKVVRDEDTGVPQTGSGFPYHLSISGKNSFSSGRAYWEVELTSPNTPIKTSWLIGVTNASDLNTIMRKLNDQIGVTDALDLTEPKKELTPSKGFWFLYSCEKTGIHANTEPELSLPIVSRPERVGVLLDYDQGGLSFYNAKEGIHLITMKTQFQGEVFPLFNPGIGDKAPLKILDIPEPPVFL